MEEAPYEGPITVDMWKDHAAQYLADMCALAGEHGVDVGSLDLMEAYSGNVTDAVNALAAENARLRIERDALRDAGLVEMRRYAERLERIIYHDTTGIDDPDDDAVASMFANDRSEAGVADLMADER